MGTAAVLRKSEMQRSSAMYKYVAEKQAQAKKSTQIAKENAKDVLVHTGEMANQGNPQKSYCILRVSLYTEYCLISLWGFMDAIKIHMIEFFEEKH